MSECGAGLQRNEEEVCKKGRLRMVFISLSSFGARGVVMVAVTFVANKHIEVTAHPIRLWLCYIHSCTRSRVLCLVIIVHYVTLEVSHQ